MSINLKKYKDMIYNLYYFSGALIIIIIGVGTAYITISQTEISLIQTQQLHFWIVLI